MTTHLDIEKERELAKAAYESIYIGGGAGFKTFFKGWLAARSASLPPMRGTDSRQDGDCAAAFDYPKAALKRDDWDVATRRPKVAAEQPQASARHVPDSECVQSRCANATTGCWGVCQLKQRPAMLISVNTAIPLLIGANDVYSFGIPQPMPLTPDESEASRCRAQGGITQPETAASASLQADEGKGALRLFMGAAYPVAPEINPRGYNWCEAYLDQARAAAIAAKEGQQP